MATTTNFGWETPDDTDLVKDGAAAIRTLGSSVDTTTKALNPSTTLGDIEYRSATANTNARLAIGTTNQVLTVNGSGVPAWTTPTAAGDNWSLLNTGGTALTGASVITVSGISAKNKIMVVVAKASTVNVADEIIVRPNNDSSAAYSYAGIYFAIDATHSSGMVQGTNNTGTATGISLGNLPNSASMWVSGYVSLEGCNSSGLKKFQSTGMGVPGASSGQQGMTLGGFHNTSSAITSISIATAASNFDGGTVYIYTSA